MATDIVLSTFPYICFMIHSFNFVLEDDPAELPRQAGVDEHCRSGHACEGSGSPAGRRGSLLADSRGFGTPNVAHLNWLTEATVVRVRKWLPEAPGFLDPNQPDTFLADCFTSKAEWYIGSDELWTSILFALSVINLIACWPIFWTLVVSHGCACNIGDRGKRPRHTLITRFCWKDIPEFAWFPFFLGSVGKK